ncbi:poly-gamma-glutamate hydrolase family protein [Staphylococcus haemolyticus]|uniref:poly-gamma-glutamate hydrolase family protein n=1 Tax=Staphylococcus haemolyticus TaxID=1283 RepID=UPI002DB9AE4E|nr:poly-gamma-glutamate hydrolase family protein [Staphylococcus haemolyticus]MEB5760841.1 poly-gamma-glutamate hydrolase family protein [Staphylococcus haemolyticus]
MDKYHSMKELQNETIENEDWEIITEDRDSDVTILAIHGGGIEPATSEIARVIANEGQFNYFAFNGIRTKGNNELHVTSINYDNDIAMNLVKSSERAVTIHGCLGEEDVAYIGGKDNKLKERIANELNHIGVEVKEAPSHMSGVQDDNIVNCTKNEVGVQIELTSSLRKTLFKNNKFNRKSRMDESNWDDKMYDFGQAINSAIN